MCSVNKMGFTINAVSKRPGPEVIKLFSCSAEHTNLSASWHFHIY